MNPMHELNGAFPRPLALIPRTPGARRRALGAAGACAIALAAAGPCMALTTLNSGDSLTYSSAQVFSDSINFNGGTILPSASSTGGFNASLTGPISVLSTSTLRSGPVTANVSHTAATNMLTVSGPISGTGDLILNTLGSTSTAASPGSDRGRITFTGNNAGYSGKVFLQNGILTFTNSNALGSGDIFVTNNLMANTTVLNNGVALEANGNTTISNPITLAGAATLSAGIATQYRVTLQGVAGNNVFNGPILVGGTSDLVTLRTSLTTAANVMTFNGDIKLAPGGYTPTVSTGAAPGGFTLRGGAQAVNSQGVINGKITLPGINLIKTDAGTWTIASTGNDWAATTLSAGTLKNGINNALPASTVVTLGDVSGFAATVYDLSGFNQALAGLANTSTAFSGKIVTNSSATPAVLTINNATAFTYGGAGSAATLTGNLGLTKDGVGTFTLSGAGVNTYTGPTVIKEGALVISAANKLGNSKSFTIEEGGILDASAIPLLTFAADTTLTGDGTILGNVDIDGKYIAQIDPSGPGDASLLTFANAVDITNATLDIAALSQPLNDPAYLILQYGSLLGGEFFKVLNLPSNYRINYNRNGNTIALEQLVPEPATASMLMIAGGMCLLRRRRVG
jgi:autotransporter-associated beta strand protein